MKTGLQVKAGSGKAFALGDRFGNGGEGDIFKVTQDKGLAIKIYTDGNGKAREPKLLAMVKDKLCAETSMVAFPIETISYNGQFSGFLMRKVPGNLLDDLFTIPSRQAKFPKANFKFLLRVAVNLARAVAKVHSMGIVIGDINESGAMVDQNGLVTLIDADSFQYESGGRIHPSIVGKAEYTPPELQGKNLSQIKRTPDHDAFGLAVIIFQILFLGRHPFSGIPIGTEHPTIGEAISGNRFAYSPQKALTKLEPLKNTPILSDMPASIATAFEQSFGPHPRGNSSARPTAAGWVMLLEAMEKNIVDCRNNPAHNYSRNASSCPWCRFEVAFGKVLFISSVVLVPSNFRIEEVIAAIQRAKSPDRPPALVSLLGMVPQAEPSEAARKVIKGVYQRRMAAAILAAIFVILISLGNGWSVIALIPAAWLFFGNTKQVAEFKARKALAEVQWNRANEIWENEAGPKRFEKGRASLLNLTVAYKTLDTVERGKLAEIELRKKEIQLQHHLERQKISKSAIDGIGESRKFTLRTYGIETAWDINKHAILAIPGFGPSLTQSLLDWRKSKEMSFRFNPSQAADQSETTKVRNEIRSRRNSLEGEILRGLQELESIKNQTQAVAKDASKHLPAYKALLQAVADYHLVGK